ncbi:MAG: hypothetical protein CBC38_02605 [Gammaproteobacteria bacterium TMED78]|nr:MAG: hypothetical protein CBC38_02605 [Gammaproteobacteria bacterium TMED78]|tara:strand:+ start:252 stop:521 length:270 start_codon:yes stop_codon:yes gene_type:complete
MSKFFNETKIEQLSKKLINTIPDNYDILRDEIEENFKSLLSTTFSKMDLVTREEFDIQVAVLARTRKKLEDLETILSSLEKNDPKKNRG